MNWEIESIESLFPFLKHAGIKTDNGQDTRLDRVGSSIDRLSPPRLGAGLPFDLNSLKGELACEIKSIDSLFPFLVLRPTKTDDGQEQLLAKVGSCKE